MDNYDEVDLEIIQALNDLQARMARVESRLVQLMLHMGVDPHERHYESKSVARQRVPSRR
jgi:hypothetical protein